MGDSEMEEVCARVMGWIPHPSFVRTGLSDAPWIHPATRRRSYRCPSVLRLPSHFKALLIWASSDGRVVDIRYRKAFAPEWQCAINLPTQYPSKGRGDSPERALACATVEWYYHRAESLPKEAP